MRTKNVSELVQMKHKCMEHAKWSKYNRYFRIIDNDRVEEFKKTPRDSSWQVIHVSEWANIPLSKDKWIMMWNGKDTIVTSERILRSLLSKLK